jgi:hypothetical protein
MRQDNSIDIFSIMPIEVFMDDRLSKTEIRVLGAILSFRNKNTNLCWPKREQIRDRCNLPLCKISTATSHLVELGWLEKDGDGGRSRSTTYKLTVPEIEIKTVTDSVTVTKSVTVTDSVTKTVTESVRGIKQTSEQTISKNKGGAQKEKNGFSDFWEAYPKKKGKDDARKAWKKINPDEQLQATIIASVIMAKESDIDWIKEGGQYIPYPATYLNGKRWEDEISTQKSLSDRQRSHSGSPQGKGGSNYERKPRISPDAWRDTDF